MDRHRKRPAPSPGPAQRTRVKLWGRAILNGGRISWPLLAATVILAYACSAAPAQEPETSAATSARLSFYKVELDDSEFADEILRGYLLEKADIEFDQEGLTYEAVIKRLVEGSDRRFLARTTPYVLVIAQTLGAQLEVLATYQSRATGRTTYRSYFVVNRDELPGKPSRDDLERYLRDRAEQGDPALFIYHNRFSTSSYFVPSLFLRERGFYSVSGSTGKQAAVHTERVEGGSTNLVLEVARGNADLAAVWDGTKAKFEPGGKHFAEYGHKVAFVELETVIPNDLLVTSADLPSKLKQQIRTAIDVMEEPDLEHRAGLRRQAPESLGDFRYWIDFDAKNADDQAPARAARTALAGLHALIRWRPPPVIVEVRPGPGAEQEAAEDELEALLEAARQAIHLSGTELTLRHKDIHQANDLLWQLTPLHDEAVLLTSSIVGLEGHQQEFRISHQPRNGSYRDLTQRIGDLIHARLHRIRYLWPYLDDPTVIRDVAFDLPAGTPVKIKRMQWLDPAANSSLQGEYRDARVVDSNYSRFSLEVLEADAGIEGLADPLSDVAYRVALLRPAKETLLVSVFTAVFVTLMVLAAVFAALELRRREAATAAALGTG